MDTPNIKTFVSSVSEQLESTRSQIIQDLSKAGYDVSAMERFGAQPEAPRDVCLGEVRTSDIVILLVGPRYGSMLPQGISYTHAEYREAQGAGVPVIAIRIPDDEGLDAEERALLKVFAEEVGSTTTYDSLAPGESFERISPKVLAALTSARDRGDIGHRFSVFQEHERYFGPLLQGQALFTHRGPFVGREQELKQIQSFIDGAEPLLILEAPGGSGKSRLLLEAAKAASQRKEASRIYFADPSASWCANDINLLPVNSSAIVAFDDAHRRPDLDRIVAACRQHNEAIRYLVSCRPSAIPIVKPLVSSLLSAYPPVELEIRRLPKQEAEVLAGHYLGDSLRHLAGRLVVVADRNPLVVCVGAQCIAEKRVQPEVLERTPEAFRRVVLDRLLDDPALTAANRRILEVVSAIGPVITEDDQLLTQLADATKLHKHEVRRFLAILERAAFLSRRGRLVRVSPDVLADHLLYIAAVDDLGKPTGFVDHIVARFPSSLENILANAAELDWRSETVDGPNSVLRAVWRDLEDLLPTSSNRQRTELVGQLKRAAIFAPAEVVRICRWLVEHPDAPTDELMARWGVKDGSERLTDAMVEVLALIATHPDYTRQCAEMLWHLGDRDERPQNTNLNHPRRQLGDLLKYEPRTSWQHPDGAQARATKFFVERLGTPGRDRPSTWAVAALADALRRTGENRTSDGRVLTIQEFSLAGFASDLAERRKSVMGCLVDVALGDRLDEAAAALAALSTALDAPRGPFGRGLDDEEVAVWQAEAEHVIACLTRVAQEASSEVTRFLARQELRSFHRDHWPQITPAVERALEATVPVPSERFYDLLIGIPREEQLKEWEEEKARVERLRAEAAKKFWRTHLTPSAVVEELLSAIAVFRGVGRETESRAGQLVHALILSSSTDCRDFIQQLVAREMAWPLLRPALSAVHKLDPALAETMVCELSRSEAALVRANAGEAVQWMFERATDLEALVLVTQTLSKDLSPTVRAASAQALRRLAKLGHPQALSTLVSIEWSGELRLADEVLRSIDSDYGADPSELSDSDIDTLLGRVERLRTLDKHNYQILEFVSLASYRRPVQTLEMLLRRIFATETQREDKEADQWIPLPYNGDGLNLPGISQAPDQTELVRKIRDATLSAGSSARFWLPVLFRVSDPTLSAARVVLREWLASGQADKIVATATLLRGYAHNIVFSEHEMVAKILSAASQYGSDCLANAKSELFVLANSGVYSGTPGQPAPRHVQGRQEASRLVKLYQQNGPARGFYQDLVEDAEGRMLWDIELWEEEDDE